MKTYLYHYPLVGDKEVYSLDEFFEGRDKPKEVIQEVFDEYADWKGKKFVVIVNDGLVA